MARVLLIDDDDALREVHAELLGAAGHQTIQAGTGVTGIEAIRSTRPDLVICDVGMPGMDGYAVLEAVRADPHIASTPFLFLTGLDARHHFRAAMSLGADDYLAKPVRQDDLVTAVDARLARRAAERRDSERRVAELQRSVTFLLPHELRTPLTVILGGSEMLQDLHQEMTPKEIGEMATTISKAAQRLHRMVENYLLHVGMELERLTVADSPARALSGGAGADLVRDVAQAQAREYGREQDIQVVLADAQLPLAEPYARKIVSELVDNALKFSQAGQPIKVSFTTTAQAVTLAVVDAGRGMTLEQIREVGAFPNSTERFSSNRAPGSGSHSSRESSRLRGGPSTSEAVRARAPPSAQPGPPEHAGAGWVHRGSILGTGSLLFNVGHYATPSLSGGGAPRQSPLPLGPVRVLRSVGGPAAALPGGDRSGARPAAISSSPR